MGPWIIFNFYFLQTGSTVPQLPWNPSKPADHGAFHVCRAASEDSRRPVPVSERDGGGGGWAQLGLSPARLLSNLRKAVHRQDEDTRGAQCSHPLSARRRPRSQPSQLGHMWAQIFEKRSSVRVPLAGHHTIRPPKQNCEGGDGAGCWECVCLYTRLRLQMIWQTWTFNEEFGASVDSDVSLLKMIVFEGKFNW